MIHDVFFNETLFWSEVTILTADLGNKWKGILPSYLGRAHRLLNKQIFRNISFC
jgi:hypothetical protein